MNKFNFVLIVLTKVLAFFKGMSCKMGMCCESKCSKAKEKEKEEDLKDRWKGVKGLDGDKEEE